MKYKGQLYGKVAGKYIALTETADEAENRIRAEALRDSANMIRGMGRSPMVNKEFAAQCLERAAILAGEVKE